MGLAVYMNGAKAVETARKDPHKKQNPTHMAWCSHRWSLPLADLPVTIGKDHVVQVAPDPRCRHSAITLLSFIFTPYYMQFQLALQEENWMYCINNV